MKGRLVQLNVSPGGMPKLAVPEAMVSEEGVAGDWQLNRKYHGGPKRAVCLYSVELLAGLSAETGVELLPGQIGENFTTTGIDLQHLHTGQHLAVGDCVIELTDIRVPCRNLNRWAPNLMQLLKGRSGWLARVVTPAVVRAGDAITLRATLADVNNSGSHRFAV
jgi:MOSC domain-containing protein YiiM